MSLFAVRKSAKRNFRKKIEAEEDDEDKKDIQANPIQPPEKGEAKPVVKPANAASHVPRSLLSFEEDIGGDGTEFKVKKTNHTKRVAKMAEREKKKGNSEPLQAEEQVSSEDEHPANENEEAAPSVHFTQRLSEGFIPDAATIHAFRKKREVARRLGSSAPDYVSLEQAGQQAPEVASGKSRLVREDENDKSDSDEDEGEGGKGSRTFGKADGPSKQMRVISALENVATDSEDEETRRWEEEQINKGVKVIAPQKPAPMNQHVTQDVIDQSFLYGTAPYPPPPFNGAGMYDVQQDAFRAPPTTASRAPQMPENLVPITVETLKSRLLLQLEDVKQLHSTHTQRLQQIVEDLAVAERDISRVESLSSTVGRDYEFYQEMRGYLRDQLSCLAEKVSNPVRLRVCMCFAMVSLHACSVSLSILVNGILCILAQSVLDGTRTVPSQTKTWL